MTKVIETKRARVIRSVLWISFILALAASVTHLIDVFGSLERPGDQWVAIVAALSVDGGIASLSYAWGWKRRTGQGARGTVAVLAFLMLLSTFANLSHAVAVATGQTVTLSTFATLDLYTLVKVLLLSASLPIVAFSLGELLSADDTHTAVHAQRMANTERKAERARVREVQTTEGGGTFPAPIEHARRVKVERDRTRKADALNAMVEHLDTQPDAPVSELVTLTGRSRTTIYNYLRELEQSGRIAHRNGQVNA